MWIVATWSSSQRQTAREGGSGWDGRIEYRIPKYLQDVFTVVLSLNSTNNSTPPSRAPRTTSASVSTVTYVHIPQANNETRPPACAVTIFAMIVMVVSTVLPPTTRAQRIQHLRCWRVEVVRRVGTQWLLTILHVGEEAAW